MFNTLDFERIMELSYKACKLIHYTYHVDLALCDEKALDVWIKKRDTIEQLADYGDLSKSKAEKKIYFVFKDYIRTELGIYQTRNSEGKTVWYSPYMDETMDGYDTVHDDEIGLEVYDIETQKKIYYEHQKDFRLTKTETLFIDLVFSGYNPTNHVDVLVFKEILNTRSMGYVKTFFNRLCKKLRKQSIKIGLR